MHEFKSTENMGNVNEWENRKDQPDPLQYIKRKSNLKLLGVIFEDNPTNWDTHFDQMLSKATVVLVFTFCVSANTMDFRFFVNSLDFSLCY